MLTQVSRFCGNDANLNSLLELRHPRDKSEWIGFERAKCGPEGERQDACSKAGISYLLENIIAEATILNQAEFAAKAALT